MFGHVGVSLFVASALFGDVGETISVPGAIFGHVGVSLFRGKRHCLAMLERQFLWQVQHLAG